LWCWEHAMWMQFREREAMIRYAPMAYLRPGPGKALDGESKYDLTRFNNAYFDRLRARVVEARERGIYVGVMLFQGFSIEQKGTDGVDPKKGNPWDGHPFNRANNINRIDGDTNKNGEGEETHTLANSDILKLQEARVRKTIDVLNDLDNIIWEISNESHGESVEWQYHIIRFIREYEKKKPLQHPIWMSVPHPDGKNEDLYNSTADAISPNGKQYKDDPPEGDGRKVLICDTDHFNPWLTEGEWAWKAFLRGLNPIVMDRYKDVRFGSPKEVIKDGDPVRRAMGQTNEFAQKVDLAQMTPMNELSSTGYCLANPGKEYLVYQPRSEKLFWVDLPAGSYRVDLYSPRKGKVQTSIGLQSEIQKNQTVPIFFYGDVVAHIKAIELPSVKP